MPSIRQLFLRHVAQTSETPLQFEPVDSNGIYLIDVNGKRHIDLISGICVSVLGHKHPAVVKAIHEQTDKYLHTMVYGEHIQNPQVALAERLASVLPDTLDSVYYVNSGSEAIEGALKLAKRHTGRSNVVACRNAYHGSTHGALSLMSDPTFTAAFRPLVPNVQFIEFNQQDSLDLIDESCACLVMEVVQGEGGYILPDSEFLKAVKKKCSETGCLLVFDEVQTGFGKTGNLFAFEKYGVIPDILVLAKGLGAGMPLGCFISDRVVMQSLTHDPILGHITTFGGHPLSCAAGLASLNTILDEKLIDSVEEKGQQFRSLLQHPIIRSVSGSGLLLKVRLSSFEQVEESMKRCLEKGLLIDWFLFDSQSLRIAPPIIISDEQIIDSCRILLEVFDELENGN